MLFGYIVGMSMSANICQYIARLAVVVAVLGPGIGWLPACAQQAVARVSGEAPFLVENNKAMRKMMAGMKVTPTRDVDTDFAAVMIPHHQGAIDMAIAELRYGRNEQLRRIAQEIIVDQQQEIAAMRLALGQSLPSSVAAPTQKMNMKQERP